MEPWGIHLLTFLVGAATGAAGNYFASEYTDRRRDSEKAKKAKDAFTKVKDLMPELISEMMADFTKIETSYIREFFVVPNDELQVNSKQQRFLYCENQHQNLMGKISVLENHGYVIDITVSNTPIYRITEEFWDLVRRS